MFDRHVHDIDSTFYIVPYRYKCSNRRCRSTFTTLDRDWLDTLPPHISCRIPVVRAVKTAYSVRLCRLICTLLTTGASVGDLHDGLARARVDKYVRVAANYYARCSY